MITMCQEVNVHNVQCYLSHRQNSLVKFFSEIIVVLLQWLTEQVIRKVQEREAVEGAENV